MIKMGKLWTRVKYKYSAYINSNINSNITISIFIILGLMYVCFMLLKRQSSPDVDVLKGGAVQPQRHMSTYEISAYLKALKDTRPDRCWRDVYDDKEFKSISVSFLLHFVDNEFYHLKLALTSLVKYTPSSMLNEIIIIDDASTTEHSNKLDTFLMEEQFKGLHIKSYSSKSKDGATYTRMKAATASGGDILIFISSYIVFNVGWLQPLIRYLMKNPQTIAVPHMDGVLDNYRFVPVDPDLVTVPTWTLSTVLFKKNLYNHDSDMDLPVMNGKLFGISKQYYTSLGEYDSNMSDAGADLELSLRTWLCGGKIVKVACSRVAAWNVYTPIETYTSKSVYEIAELWFDDKNKQHIYKQRDIPSKLEHYQASNIRSRKFHIRYNLHNKCENMLWYLEHVSAGEVFNPPGEGWQMFGKIRSASGKCLNTVPNTPLNIQLSYCKPSIYDPRFIFEYTYNDQLTVAQSCLVAEKRASLRVLDCLPGLEGIQQWIFQDNGHIKNKAYKLCLEVLSDNVILSPCDENNNGQIWSLIKY